MKKYKTICNSAVFSGAVTMLGTAATCDHDYITYGTALTLVLIGLLLFAGGLYFGGAIR